MPLNISWPTRGPLIPQIVKQLGDQGKKRWQNSQQGKTKQLEENLHLQRHILLLSHSLECASQVFCFFSPYVLLYQRRIRINGHKPHL